MKRTSRVLRHASIGENVVVDELERRPDWGHECRSRLRRRRVAERQIALGQVSLHRPEVGKPPRIERVSVSPSPGKKEHRVSTGGLDQVVQTNSGVPTRDPLCLPHRKRRNLALVLQDDQVPPGVTASHERLPQRPVAIRPIGIGEVLRQSVTTGRDRLCVDVRAGGFFEKALDHLLESAGVKRIAVSNEEEPVLGRRRCRQQDRGSDSYDRGESAPHISTHRARSASYPLCCLRFRRPTPTRPAR